GPAEVDLHRAALEARDGAGDDGADAILEFFVNAAAFVGSNELDDDLLDRLRADAADDLKVKRLAVAGCGDLAGHAVKVHLEFAGVFGVEVLAKPAGDRLLDVGVDLLALDALVARDAIYDTD